MGVEEIGKRRVKLLCHRRHRVYPVCVLLLNFLLPTLAAPKIRQIFFFKKTFFDSLYIPYTVKNLFILSAGKHIVVQKLSNPPPLLHFYYGTPLFLLFGRMLLFDGGEKEKEDGQGRSFPLPSSPGGGVQSRRCSRRSWWCQDWRGRRGGGFFLAAPNSSFPPLLFYGYRIREEACCVVLTLDMGKKGEKSDAGKIAFVGLNCPSLEKV